MFTKLFRVYVLQLESISRKAHLLRGALRQLEEMLVVRVDVVQRRVLPLGRPSLVR